MVEYLRDNAVECVQYAVQYRNIDMNDKEVNEIYASLIDKI